MNPGGPERGRSPVVGPEAGSASVLLAGVASAVLMVAVACSVVLRTSTELIRVGASADAAALAAAGTAVGHAGGLPCEAAGRVASAGGATVTSCRVDRAIVTVRVTSTGGAFAVGATARAGPAVPLIRI